MPAILADIAAATREAETVQWGSSDIGARYVNARDGAANPATGYFDDPADAAAVLAARGGLIGVDRNRFAVVTNDLLWPDLTALGSIGLVDDEAGASGDFLPARIEIDLDAETTSHELFG